MKTNKLLATLAFAIAAGTASTSAFGATGGNIVDIRVVDTDEMVFSGTAGNELDTTRLCTMAHPLTAEQRHEIVTA